MAAVAERSHANILPDPPPAPDPVSVTMPFESISLQRQLDRRRYRCLLGNGEHNRSSIIAEILGLADRGFLAGSEFSFWSARTRYDGNKGCDGDRAGVPNCVV